MTINIAVGQTQTAEVEALRHALGLDPYGQGDLYRAYYVAEYGTDDYTTCKRLADQGYMVERASSDLTGGAALFLVVDKHAAQTYVVQNSPKPPKLTRSQRRYRAYLRADSSLTFKEWITRGY